MVCSDMGCISSKREPCANVFQVVNVDDYGNQLNSGQLEVTEMELVFYQHGKTPVRWPLRTLRRYGFDSERFTFEFGRRSPTGPGIYSFMCKRAEHLVLILEAKLQVRTHSETDSEGNRHISHRLSSVSSGGPLSPLTSTAPMLDSLPVIPLPRPLSQNLYANEEVFAPTITQTTPTVAFPPLATPPPVAAPPVVTQREPHYETNNNKLSQGLDNCPENTYVNTCLGGPDFIETLQEEESPPSHLYENIVTGTKCKVIEYPIQLQLPQYVTWERDEMSNNYENIGMEHNRDCPRREITYTLLDLKPEGEQVPRTSTSSLPADSPKKQPLGYATIDFDKTTALCHSIDPSFDDSQCSRKTRHNSNMSDLPRHSSSVSD